MTLGRVVETSVGGITRAVYWLCRAVSRAILWTFALPFHMAKLFRRASGISAPAKANITASTFPFDGSPEPGLLPTCSASGQNSIPARAAVSRVAPSPAAMWLASTIHQLLSTVIFLLNYPANFVCDFITAVFEIMGIPYSFIIVPLGFAATALLGLFLLQSWKQILKGQRCQQKYSPGEEMVFVFFCTLCWAATWRSLAMLGTPDSVIGFLGAALIITAFIEGRVQNCSYVVCMHVP